MSVTFSAMANVASQSALAMGQAQANQMGLGQTEANAMGVTNLMGGGSESESSPTTKQEFGASVVSKTLGLLNKGSKSSHSITPSFQTQMDILGGASKGGILNTIG